jgi:hypothetical protein
LAKQIKDLKCDRGIPDLWIIKRIDPYPGLVLELKTTINTPFLKDGTISKDKHVQEQVAVMRSITKEGYLVLFGVGINDSVKIIEMYMIGDIVGILELLKDKNQKYD